MMPAVSPPPLSAWMLLGTTMAYPHPRASTCCCQVGPDGPRALTGGAPGFGAAPPGAAAFGVAGGPVPGAPAGAPPRPAGPRPGPKPPPNCITTGTGAFAFAGVLRLNWMSTVICG